MELKHFYFLTDQYFIDFPDPYLMNNHEIINGVRHDRPCFYAIEDSSTGLCWMIPISSKTNKYQKIYNDKITKNGQCDTIVFGDILGQRKAFLIQNMCPIDDSYVRNEYLDSANQPVRVIGSLETELEQKALKVLNIQRKGKKLIFPDVLKIEKELLSKCNTEI